jgi:ABC-type transporter Mla MlaB component
MFHFHSRAHGFILTLDGEIDAHDMRGFVFELENELAGAEGPFVLQINVQTLHHFTADAQALFEECLENAKIQGLYRVTVLAKSTAHASLFCDMMVRSELMSDYQFLDVSYEEDWEMEMETWLGEAFAGEET